MQIYCLKCKQSTASMDEKKMPMKNGGMRVAAKCAVCGSGKSKIISRTE